MALLDATSNTTNITNQTAGGTTTISHTCTGTGLCLIVSIMAWNNGGTGTGCSGVTYNGASMSPVGNGSTNGAFYTEQWYLYGPSTGANNIVATVAGKTDKLGLTGISFTAVSSPGTDVNTSATGTGATVTASVTTSNASEYLIDCVAHLSANNPTSGTGTQLLSDSASGVSTASQYKAVGKGLNGLSWTYPDPGDAWAYSVTAVLGTAPTSDPGNIGKFLRVGNGMSRSEVAN